VKDHDAGYSYEFDTIVIWRRNYDGRHVIAHDSGCSCPIPFENTGIEDLTVVRSRADVADYARGVDWDEEHVVALLDGLRLDGLPAVVEGQVADAGLTTGPRQIEQAPPDAPTDQGA
jgi:hypothetical protein